jgi:3-hydroxyacyl-CoA dehydrogenase/enoyl-CoA hydratase/3-hydroxybutyryl-CoA epimerase
VTASVVGSQWSVVSGDVGGAVRFEAPDEDGIGRIVIDRPDDSVNAVNPSLVEELAQAVRAARSYEALRGLIVASGKATQFVAGADLKMVGRATDSTDLEAISRRFQAVLDELAWLPCTTVAAINGPALGGGLELALACDYRVGIDAPGLSVGQPEVNLGLVPAGGGTQRLPRLIGLQASLDLILSGRRLNARRARRMGLLDEVVHPTVLQQAARAWALRSKRPLDRALHLGFSPQAAIDVAELTPAGRALMYGRARDAVIARTHGHYPAPLRALAAIEIGLEKGTAAGLEAEARAFAELAATDIARNLIWLFMTTQRQKRLPGTLGPPRVDDRIIPKDQSSTGIDRPDAERTAEGETASRAGSGRPEMERMGVVGAGFMGAAIAEVGAAAGLAVRVRDVKPEAVAKGLSSIRKMLDDGVARRRFDAREARQILQLVSGTTDYSGFQRADLVIEAVFEDLAIKQKVVQELEANVRPETVIASNTSAIPINEIAKASKYPERIVGMHFFSPAERMPLLEVIRPDAAADWALQAAVALGTKMGKTVIVVGDSPGFYTSRVLGVMMNEAALMLTEGAGIEDVDRAMTAFGFPVGPFVLYDEVGLEVAQHAGETVARAFGDRVPRASVVPQLVAAGQTGRKAGAGFYVWHTSHIPRPLRGIVKRPSRTVNPDVYRMSGAPTQQKAFGEQAIQDRLALLFVNEAIRCLHEGVLQSAADGDLGAVLGLGFPPFRGGPFHYADTLGLTKLANTLSTLATAHGSRYEPSELLVERARQGRTFFEE